jgi:hypothetical protein
MKKQYFTKDGNVEIEEEAPTEKAKRKKADAALDLKARIENIEEYLGI